MGKRKIWGKLFVEKQLFKLINDKGIIFDEIHFQTEIQH